MTPTQLFTNSIGTVDHLRILVDDNPQSARQRLLDIRSIWEGVIADQVGTECESIYQEILNKFPKPTTKPGQWPQLLASVRALLMEALNNNCNFSLKKRNTRTKEAALLALYKAVESGDRERTYRAASDLMGHLRP